MSQGFAGHLWGSLGLKEAEKGRRDPGCTRDSLGSDHTIQRSQSPLVARSHLQGIGMGVMTTNRTTGELVVAFYCPISVPLRGYEKGKRATIARNSPILA